jgi:hypothetical protein
VPTVCWSDQPEWELAKCYEQRFWSRASISEAPMSYLPEFEPDVFTGDTGLWLAIIVARSQSLPSPAIYA